MKLSKYIIVITYFLIVSTRGEAQEVLTLSRSVDLALENNLNIKVAASEATISANNATKGNAGLLPTITASGDVNYSDNAASELSTTSALNFSYILFNGFGARHRYDILKFEKEHGKLQAKYKIENIVTDVVSRFFSLCQSWDNLKSATDNMAISKERYDRNVAKYEFGNINKLEVLNARVDYSRDSSSYVLAKHNYAQDIREMNVLLGRDPSMELKLIPDRSEFGEYDLGELREDVQNKNMAYQMAVNVSKQNDANLRQAKRNLMPKLSLNSGYSVSGKKNEATGSNTQLTGNLNLSFDIFNGRTKRLAINNAKVQQDISDYQKQEQLLQLYKNLSNAFANYQYSLQSLDIEEEALVVSKMNFEKSKEYYSLGQITSTAFREAQLSWLEAQNKRSAAHYEAKKAEVEIKRISGLLVQ